MPSLNSNSHSSAPKIVSWCNKLCHDLQVSSKCSI